jgi:hypothetical protein
MSKEEERLRTPKVTREEECPKNKRSKEMKKKHRSKRID